MSINKIIILLGRLHKAERNLLRDQLRLAELRADFPKPRPSRISASIRVWLGNCQEDRRELRKAHDLLLAAFSTSEQAINHSLDILFREPNGVIASNAVEEILRIARADVRVMLKGVAV